MSADRFQNLLVRPAGFAHHLAVLGLPTTELPTSSVAVQVFELLHDVLHGNTATDSEELDDLVDALFAPVLSAMLSAGAARVVLVEVEQVLPNCSQDVPRLAFADSNQDMTP